MRSLRVPLALISLLALAPTGCGSDEPGFQYGAAEVQAALDGVWTGTWTTSSGKNGTLTLSLALASPPATTKCGSRTLAGDLAPKCIDSTSVAVTGSLTTTGGDWASTPLTGWLNLWGITLTAGNLSLAAPDARALSAEWSSGAITGNLPIAAETATFSLTRSAK